MSLKKLMDLISKLRIVKHGDTILADDHNSLVNVSKAIQELILPSGLLPIGGTTDRDLFDNFLSPSGGSVYVPTIGCYITYFSKVGETSISKNTIRVVKYTQPLAEYTYIPAFYYSFESVISTEPKIYPCRFGTSFKIINPNINENVFIPLFNFDIYINKDYYGGRFGVLLGKNYTGFVVIDVTNPTKPEDYPTIDVFNDYYSYFVEVDKDSLNNWYILYIIINTNGYIYINVYDKNYNSVLSYRFKGSSISTSSELYATFTVLSCFDVWRILEGYEIPNLPVVGNCMYDWLTIDYARWGSIVL